MQKVPDHFNFMLGTGGTPDYLEVSHRGLVKLGVKPLINPLGIQPNRAVTFIGFRVRVVPVETSAMVNGAMPLHPEKTYETAYPFLKLDKENETRGSTVVGGILSVYYMQKERYADAIGEIAPAKILAEWIYNKICPKESHMITLEEFTNWLDFSYNSEIREMQKVAQAEEGFFSDAPLIPFEVDTFENALNKAVENLSQEAPEGGIAITKNGDDE